MISETSKPHDVAAAFVAAVQNPELATDEAITKMQAWLEEFTHTLLAEEREACARMVERHNGMGGTTTLAAAIRART